MLELDPGLRDQHLADLAPALDAELAAVALAHVDDAFLRGLLAAGLPEAERAAAGERALEAVAEAAPYVRDVLLAQLADALPDALVPRALELADTDEALAALVPRLGEDRVRDAFARATGPSALLALAPRLPDDLVQPAFDAAAACTGGGEALAALAPRLPDDLVRSAFETAAACTGGGEAMAVLARRLPEDALDDALAAAGASVPVLAVLAPRLSEGQLREAVRVVGHDRWALATLAPHLPSSLLTAAVVAAGAGSSSDRAYALASVAPYVRGAAEAALRADPDIYVLARVAPFLQPPEREARLLAALEALDELPAEACHGAAVALLPHLSGERRARALAYVDLSIVTSTDVEVLLGDLSDPDVAQLLEQLDPFEDEELLEALAPRLTLDALLEALGETEHEDLMEILLSVAPHLPAGEREAALARVDVREEPAPPEGGLAAAVAAGNWGALEYWAPRLPARALEPVVEPAAAIRDPDLRALALAALAARLSGAPRARAITAITGPLRYARPLLALGADAAPLVALVTDPGERAQLLAAAAPGLGAAELHRQVHETLRLAAARGGIARALAELGPVLGRLHGG